MDINLKDKWAMVCGSTQGIGFATAHAMAELGANIVLVARNEEKLKAAREKLSTAQGQEHHYIVADFQYPSKVKEAVEAYLKEHPPVHILVNNTGGPPGGPAIDADVEEYLGAFNAHLVCNQHITQSVVPGMKKEGYGRIINVISTSVKQPLPNLGVSNTIRGAVANWAKTLANELGQYNITVNNVLPGATNTSRLESIIAKKAEKTGKSESEVQEDMANAIPMKRVARPEEVANAITFLSTPAASYINGINVPVDGGRTKSL